MIIGARNFCSLHINFSAPDGGGCNAILKRAGWKRRGGMMRMCEKWMDSGRSC